MSVRTKDAAGRMTKASIPCMKKKDIFVDMHGAAGTSLNHVTINKVW